MLEHYLLLGTLGFHSLEDIKSRQITVMVTLGSALAGLILLFSVLSKGKIGQGDGIVFMLTGLYLGVEKNLALMLLSFVLAGCWAFLLIIFLHRDKKEKIPFIPFLFLAYLLILVL